MILAVAIIVAVLIVAGLTFAPFTKCEAWKATVTPLASIIGSGFLVCAPLLAQEFGRLAAPAMAILLVLAYIVGSVIRFNIKNVEPYLADAVTHDATAWLARLTQISLSLAYAIAVAYYLKLLAAFALQGVQGNTVGLSNGIVTFIIVCLAIIPFTGGLRKVEHLAHATVSIKLGIIGGLLAALAVHWLANLSTQPELLPAKISAGSPLLLLGLLITVQGFETSRYLGGSYSADLRVKTMRTAQWIAAAIYLAFLLLMTPFLATAAKSQGVAGILDVVKVLSPGLVAFVLIGAVTSQLSAAIADSIGAAGLATEISQNRLKTPAAYALASGLAVAVVWLTDPYQVIAWASRAFAVYYALQCALAFVISRKSGVGSGPLRFGFFLIAAVCLLAAIAGAPAE